MKLHKVLFVVMALAMAAQCGTKPQERLAVLCDSLCAGIPDSLKELRIAVIPFSGAAVQKGSGAGLAVAEYFIARMQKNKRFLIIDRLAFQKVLIELQLSESGIIDESKAVQVGKMMSAQYLLTGSITEIFGESRVFAKIIRTETTEIVSAASVAVQPSAMEGFAKDMLSEKGQISATVFRSLVAPGWGQYYAHEYVRGTVSMVACAAMLGFTLYSAQQSANANKKYHDYNAYLFTDAWKSDMKRDTTSTHASWFEATMPYLNQDTLNYKDYSRKYDRFILAGAITIGVWSLNVIDALICGMQSKRKFQLYFSGDVVHSAEAGLVMKF